MTLVLDFCEVLQIGDSGLKWKETIKRQGHTVVFETLRSVLYEAQLGFIPIPESK